MQGESGGIEKLIRIGDSGWVALMAGDPTIGAQVVDAAERRLAGDHSVASTLSSMMDCMKEAYQEVREVAVLDRILRPRMLTKELFAARSAALLPLDDGFFRDTAARVSNFTVGCTLLVCGFDAERDGSIFSVQEPGVSLSHQVAGFHAVGIGAEVAISRLLWNAAEEEDPLDVAIYQVLEAKGHAEIIQGVGLRQDLWVMQDNQLIPVPEEINNLLVDVFNHAARSPFYRGEEPPDWRAELARFARNPTRWKPPRRRT